MQPLVSIVVPVFNGMPYIKATIDSILAQTYEHFELVISEGGGADGSLAYLQGLKDPRIRIIEMKPGTSAAQNWTAATLAARGEFTKLVCQDDLLYPKAIEQQVQDLLKFPSAVMATARRDIVDARGAVVYSPRGLGGLVHLHGDAIPATKAVRACYLSGTNVLGEPFAVLFRTAALKSVMPWTDENPLMLDLSTYQRIAPLGDVVIRREAIGAFRVSVASWSTRIANQQLDQTKAWQNAFAQSAMPAISWIERARAMVGRHVQTNLRRLAYRALRLRRTLEATRG